MARKCYIVCPNCRKYYYIYFHKIGKGYYECESCRHIWIYDKQQSRDIKKRIIEVWEN